METKDVTGWVAKNPCDHEYPNSYFLGNLAIAGVKCAQDCPITTYKDNYQVCHACPVVGCETCGSKGGCQGCLLFHLRSDDDQCLFLLHGIFGAVALFTCCLVLCGLLRFCCLGFTSAKSPGVLECALAHRRRAKVHNYSLPGNLFYAFDDTNVRRQNVSGLAPALYFRFVAFQAMLSFLLILLLLIGYYLPAVTQEGTFLPQLVPEGQLGLAQQIHAAVLYATCLLACLRWVWTQDRAARTDAEEEAHLRNYCLLADGFPKSARSPHEVKAFFESILGFELEGVSIAYDLGDEVDFVEDRISKTVEQADTHLGIYPAELANADSKVGESQDSYVLDCLASCGQAFVVFSREEDREFCIRRFGEINRQVRQGLHKLDGGPEDDDEEAEESQALLGTSGPSRSRGSRGGRAPGGLSSAVLFRGKFPVTVSEAPEPCGITWQNFQVQGGLKLSRVVITFLVCLLLVCLVSAVVYTWGVLYKMSFTDIRNPTKVQERWAVLEQLDVTACTAIGGRLFASAMRKAAESGGFVQKVNEDSVYCACAFIIMLCSSVAPLVITALVAYGNDIRVTRALATQWLFQVLYLTLVWTELNVIFSYFWSYWSAYFWVRQSRYITVREAEPGLTTTDFPLAARYVDLLHALGLMLTMIAIDSTSVYTISADCLMLLYSLYVYFVDKYFFLRMNRQTYYTSPKLDFTVHYLLVIQMMIVALLPLQLIFFDIFQERRWLNLAVLAGSALVYLTMVRISQNCNDPQRDLSDVPYVEVASLVPYNYFNTNHAHVLRTLHFPSIVVPPIYPFSPGKEYLQGGQFADYDDSVRLRETLMLLAKNPLKGYDDFGNPQDLG
eukprot:TRINITY_DN90620_c0_g1_i1.p1 TRINITY_DN90620_c0_g1~~TRINITY_DN90620_c0_g1_i1.p1  ORF type:complete len:841 (-),score=112.30 TRINITY_DN90620_c0_g1_i1:60-2582(-)